MRWKQTITYKLDIEVPGTIKHQEILEEEGKLIYRAKYINQDGRLLEKNWIITTDINGKEPVVNVLGRAKEIPNTGQFNLQEVGGKAGRRKSESFR